MKVWNKRDPNTPKDAIYVGRPTIFGNPFVIGRDGDRDAVIELYQAWFLNQPEVVALAIQMLRGKDLACWCAPQACHADVLMFHVNVGNAVGNNGKSITQPCP